MAKTKEVYVEIKVVPIGTLVPNEDNPRRIRDKRFKELVQSLKDFPEMKKLREIIVDENNLVLAGNQRLEGLKYLKYSDVEVKQVFNLSEEKKREFIAKDNDHYGEWDADAIANNWDTDLLKEWGIDSIRFDGFNDDEENKTNDKATGKKDVQVICPCGCDFVFPVAGNQYEE